MVDWNMKTSSVVVVCVGALRIREATDPLLLGEEGSYVPYRDADEEVELADSGNCTICTCWICCNGRDCWR